VFDGKKGQKRADMFFAQIQRVDFVVMDNKTFDPSGVCIYGSWTIITPLHQS